MNITMQGKYQTRNGLAVEVLRNNVKHPDFPIVGIITYADGSQSQDRWMADGKYDGGSENGLDLVPVPTKHEGWVVVGWQNEDGCYLTNKVIWNTRQEAVEQASHLSGIEQFIACVTWED